MYDLGEYFKFDLSLARMNNECIFKGSKYRITILTERLVRIEYNEMGTFIDNPSILAWYRNFTKPKFLVEETDKTLKITTKYFSLFYKKEMPYKGSSISPTKNFRIELLNTDKVWYYNHPEIRNFGYYNYSEESSKLEKNKGLYSEDGFCSLDDSKTPIILENGMFKKRETEGVDTYIFLYNKDFYYCLNDYFKLTGYPPLLPRYAFGNWFSKNQFYTEFDVAHLARKFEENLVPISMITLTNWEDDIKYKFKSIYREIPNIINFLNQKNIRLGLEITDIVDFSDKVVNFDIIKQYKEANKKGKIPFNVFDERCIDAYFKLIIHPIDKMGINYYYLSSTKDNDRLSMLRHYLYRDSIKDLDNRPILMSKDYLYGSHRYSLLYSGDESVSFDTLKNIVKINTSSSNIGISYFSHDFGGSIGGVEDSELFTRFIQLGTFSPIFRLGAGESKYYKREPWKWDISTNKITSDYMRLRYKLIPYIYTEAYKYYKYGKPLIEPIYYRYPSLYDDVLYCNNYFFGSTFYICPILSKKDEVMDRVIHKLYIPDGIWYDYFTGKKYTGNKKYVSFYKTDEYPVFVKSGAIIPLSTNKFNDTSIPKTLEIAVFPGDNNTYSIYEDDGLTNKYQKDEYVITNIEFLFKKDNYTLTILPVAGNSSILPSSRNYKIRMKNTKPSALVKAYSNGNKIMVKRYKDSNDLIVELENIKPTSQITIIFSGKDIEIEALRIINDDIVGIISDLPLKTSIKQKIDSIMFSQNISLKKKRIEIRKLNSLGRKYINLFLRLLEYINEV